MGKPPTPTPHGSFFVEESVRMRPGAPGGPRVRVANASIRWLAARIAPGVRVDLAR